MTAIATSVTGVNVSNYPQADGYHVYVFSQNGIEENTTNVYLSDYKDAIKGGSEVTAVSFVAVFKRLDSFQFNRLTFYTQSNGLDVLQVAEFVLTYPITKPSNYVLIVYFEFSISTPIYVYNPVADVEQECNKHCFLNNCYAVAGNIETKFIPFSPFNLTFIYLLGLTVDQITGDKVVQQQAQQYYGCMANCASSCLQGNLIGCIICIIGCQLYLLNNPIATYVKANNIQSLQQLLPTDIGNVYGVNVCYGKVATFQPQGLHGTLDVLSQSEIQYVVQFDLPGTDKFFNALQITLSTPSNNSYSLGVLYFLGIPLPTGNTYNLTVTVNEG
jgi:hypothetical protein